MVGAPYDCLANPLGAVRYTFEKAVSAKGTEFDPAAFDRRDWGAVDLFRKFLFEQNGLSQVPLIEPDNLGWIQPNMLVRYRGIVQDMFNSELYIGAFKDGTTWRTNKFTDVPIFQMSPTCEKRLWERRLYYCVPVPGQNSWTFGVNNSHRMKNALSSSTSQHGEKRRRDDDTNMMEFDDSHEKWDSGVSPKKQKEDHFHCQSPIPALELAVQNKWARTSTEHSSDLNHLSCLIKIYDTHENDLKLNDVIEFIGIYTYDPELSIQEDDCDELSFDPMDDLTVILPPSKVPRLHCITYQKLIVQDFLLGPRIAEPSPDLIRGIRESLLSHLTMVLGNDSLAAHYLLLHLLSRVRARVDSIAVGPLSLNLSGLTRESASIFGNQLISSFKCILPFSQAIPLTVEYLNNSGLQPRKDNQMGRLVSGTLQLAEGTHLMIDETFLSSGTLNSTGIENARVLRHLLKQQMVEYDFEFYKLEMHADVQLLVLSDGKSNILPTDIVIPVQLSVVSSSGNVDEEKLQAWRWYLATLRFLPHSIEPELQKVLEEDWVAARKEDGSLQPEDLSRWLTMAQLMSASFCETSLSVEHWRLVRELERLRKERIC